VINAVWSGAPERGAPTVRRLVEDARPAAARIGMRPYLELQTMQDDMHPHGQYNHMRSRYLTAFDDGAVEALRAAVAEVPGPHSQIEVLRLGGAVAEVPVDATAFSGRDAPFLANIVATWTDPAQEALHTGWARRTYAALDPVGSDAGYVNFLGDEPERARSVYAGATYARLQQVKARLDPEDVFHGNVAIRPAGSAGRPVDNALAR
jgi:hypothetical protein